MPHERPRLLVLGSGFAAFSLLNELAPDLYDVTVVSPRPYFLYTPLLTEVAVGGVRGSSLIERVDSLPSVTHYRKARCIEIEPSRKIVQCRNLTEGVTEEIPYDTLVIAVGGMNSTCSVPGVEDYGYRLRSVEDAISIHRKVLDIFESIQPDDSNGTSLADALRIVLIGSAAKIFELKGALQRFINSEMSDLYPLLAPHAEVRHLQAMDEPEDLADKRLFRSRRGSTTQIETEAPVSQIMADRVLMENGEEMLSALTVWGTSIGSTPIIDHVPCAKDENQRIVTDEYFRISEFESVYAVGDCVNVSRRNDPRTAHVAMGEGTQLGKNLSRLSSGEEMQPFELNASEDQRWRSRMSVIQCPLLSTRHKIEITFDQQVSRFFGRRTLLP